MQWFTFQIHNTLKQTEENRSIFLTTWREQVDLSDNYSECRQELIWMFEPFSTMLDEQLGIISVAEYHIEIAPGATLVHSGPCQAGP